MLRLTLASLLAATALAAIGCFASGGAGETDFARDRGGESPVPFDGKRAMGYLEEVCKIGPRKSGTEGMKRQQDLVRKHFEDLGATVEFQRFTAKQKSQSDSTEMANLIIKWFPERQRRVIICSHYDTRPIADREESKRNWEKPFISANDGGSGVAFLMEMAHHIKELKIEVGVDFVLFDGEEYVFNPHDDDYFIGSTHFAQTYRKDKPRQVYLAAVLLDMIAGKNVSFPVEPNSAFLAGPLVDQLWTIAAEQKCSAFNKDEMGRTAEDDHIPLNRIAHIPAVDIIDFEYKHWHKLSDVPSNCSPEGMGQVSRVLSVWLQRVK